MIDRDDLERLAKLKSEHGILSAYVRLDPRLRFMRRQAATQFKGALKQAERRVQNGRWREALERESARRRCRVSTAKAGARRCASSGTSKFMLRSTWIRWPTSSNSSARAGGFNLPSAAARKRSIFCLPCCRRR